MGFNWSKIVQKRANYYIFVSKIDADPEINHQIRDRFWTFFDQKMSIYFKKTPDPDGSISEYYDDLL